jgi:AraC-like DNA-binding protein
MIDSIKVDTVFFLANLLKALQPFLKEKNIEHDFTTSEKEVGLGYSESELLAGFTKLIRSIIDYMPDNNTLYFSAVILRNEDGEYFSMKIKNTGINLKRVTAIIKNSSLPVTVFSSTTNETTFEVRYSLKPSATLPLAVNGSSINYTAFVKGIQTHFSKLNNPVVRLTDSKPKEAAFLINIIKCILDNIADERFDANALSIIMNISRAQLLRKLKASTGNSPGFYIKTMRLEKAKELLDKSDVSVSEAAFKTGFGTPSNFTKVFTEKYGITPSQFRRINLNATNK